jgi:hypothetical protein
MSRRKRRRRKNRKWIPAAVSAGVVIVVLGVISFVFQPDRTTGPGSLSEDQTQASESAEKSPSHRGRSGTAKRGVSDRLQNVLVSDQQTALQEPDFPDKAR